MNSIILIVSFMIIIGVICYYNGRENEPPTKCEHKWILTNIQLQHPPLQNHMNECVILQCTDCEKKRSVSRREYHTMRLHNLIEDKRR